MKQKSTITRKEDFVTKITCDMCGTETNHESWPDDDSTASIITIEKKKCRPDSHGMWVAERVEYDLCPTCFNKLEALFGITPTTTKYNIW